MNIIDILKNSQNGFTYIWAGEENNSEYKAFIDSKLVVHCKYKNGKLHGFYREYDPSTGKLLKECCYYEDELEGEFFQWDFQGNVISHQFYTKGKIIE